MLSEMLWLAGHIDVSRFVFINQGFTIETLNSMFCDGVSRSFVPKLYKFRGLT
jgi:hypothetical protein